MARQKETDPAPCFLEPGHPCARRIFDTEGKEVFTVMSTYRDQGNISPVEADILARVLNGYLSSASFRKDWKKAAKEHHKKE
jgi:hypothetical protein